MALKAKAIVVVAADPANAAVAKVAAANKVVWQYWVQFALSSAVWKNHELSNPYPFIKHLNEIYLVLNSPHYLEA